ncbi:MAG: acyloxyacyl hydrolase [Thermoanaerobaculia bacterium]|nr:acyloxyacyl hydrolase [Thermoanaerobaculia bacterium]
MRRPVVLACLVVALAVPAARAEKEIALHAGAWDFNQIDRAGAVEVGAELRLLGVELAKWAWGSVTPAFGALATADGVLYGYGGFRVHAVRGRWRFSLHSAAGLYEAGDGTELGGPVEFMSGVGVSARVSPRVRIGLDVSHLSNADLYDENPGVNTAVVVVSWGLAERP